MARTTKSDIETIIDIDPAIAPDEAAMAGFILAANELVTECCAGASGPSTPYSDSRLELIERYLAAHFYTLRDPRVASEGAGGVTAHYQGTTSVGFKSSHYGQMALRLDTNGGLAKLDTKTTKTPVVGIHWPGTPADEVQDMIDAT